MFVKDRMNPDPICGTLDMSAIDVQELMEQNAIKHLPIVDDSKNLLGLITDSTLLKSLPSDVKRFSRFEISYVLSQIKVKSIMITDVITTSPDTPIEDAALILADKRISTLPVVVGNQLCGIISDKDLYIAMTTLLGSRNPGIRVTIQQPDKSGLIARLTSAIAQEGGYLSVYVGYKPNDHSDQWVSVCKVENINEDRLVEVICALENAKILDIRQFQEPK